MNPAYEFAGHAEEVNSALRQLAELTIQGQEREEGVSVFRLYREERLTVRKRGGRKRALGTLVLRRRDRMQKNRFIIRWR